MTKRDDKSEYLKFIEQAQEIAQILPKYFSKFSNKIYDNHQKQVLLALKQKFRTTYKDLIEILKITNIPEILGLKRIPHYTTLIKFAKKVNPIATRELITYSARIGKPKKLQLAVDATGFDLNRGSEHYTKIKFIDVNRKRTIQMTACADTQTQLITSLRTEKRQTVVNFKHFLPIVKDSAKIGTVEFLTADKGYDDKKYHEYVIKKLNAKSYIKIREMSKKPKNKTRRYVKENFDDKKYHQRSKIETIFSVIKKRYGSNIRSQKRSSQIRETYQKALTYNIDRLVRLKALLPRGFHISPTYVSI